MANAQRTNVAKRTQRTGKEVARHVLHRLGVKRRLAYLNHANAEDRFSQIYRDRVWAHGDLTVPGSGRGSTMEATEALRSQLPALLESLGSTSVLDLGCGDFAWMSAVTMTQEYHGLDIVPEVIAANNEKYASMRRHFYLADAAYDPLPQTDTVFCREVLFHLSFRDIRALLQNVLSTGCQYFIATTDPITLFNSDIESGDFRYLNLERRPFRLGAPVAALLDPGITTDRSLKVWDSGTIETALRRWPAYSGMSGPI